MAAPSWARKSGFTGVESKKMATHRALSTSLNNIHGTSMRLPNGAVGRIGCRWLLEEDASLQHLVNQAIDLVTIANKLKRNVKGVTLGHRSFGNTEM